MGESVRFILTEELGKLVKWLRILGYDVIYYKGKEISELIIKVLREERVLVTRKSLFLKYKGLKVILIRHDNVERQIDEVLKGLGLKTSKENLFSRCVECNTLLEGIKKEDIKDKVPKYVYETQNEFKWCRECQKAFWKGTHWDMVDKWIKKVGI